MPKRRELPRDFSGRGVYDEDYQHADLISDQDILIGSGSQRARTDLEALSRCAPSEEPDLSQEALLPLRELLADAIDGLDDESRWIFEAIYIRRLSFRELEHELREGNVEISKSALHRRAHKVRAVLAAKLENEPLVAAHLKGVL